MALSSIARNTGTNVPGGCYLDFIDIRSIDTFPTELAGNLDGTITLLGSATFTRIYPTILQLGFDEEWKRVNGVLVPLATVSFTAAKDDLNKLPGLWELQTGRYVVLYRNRNDQTLCMGTRSEGAQFGPAKRSSGRDTDFSGYPELAFSIARRKPVPFYNGTPPAVDVGGGGGGSILTIDGTVGTLGSPDEALITVV